MSNLVLLGLVAIAVWGWADALASRDAMLRFCRSVCRDLGLQLLDDTVAVSRFELTRDDGGRVRLRRWYGFEFSTNGENRHRGSASVLRRSVELLRLEHPDGPILINRH